ncbi:MAG: triose-phosphate isomerase [Candidatus Omnitrophica bacterium]|nr:triose-phosphate isomerase [Candidatus Omnitrophota bacterium]
MRKSLIAGNWKMHKTINEAVQLVTAIKRELADYKGADIVVCPVYTALASTFDVLMDTDIVLGAQNLFWETQGAFTGEISPVMIKDAGCEYVIIGHSERRKYFNETEETVNKRLKAALAVGLIPIVCVGETLEERESDKTESVVKSQLEGGFKGLQSIDVLDVVIAYEPVWAIGTGKTATPEQAQNVHNFIRQWVKQNFCEDTADKMRIIYGGSVKPDNAKDLMSQDDIDGALVGGAALDVGSFCSIVKNCTISL